MEAYSQMSTSADPAGRHSSSPDGSDGNDSTSAPSEFLAEFLSAILRRQHAEALKYCRLILQYEPHNATARGFYPLLRHKLLRASDASGDDASPASSPSRPRSACSSGSIHQDAGAGEASHSPSDYASSESSLELDSSGVGFSTASSSPKSRGIAIAAGNNSNSVARGRHSGSGATGSGATGSGSASVSDDDCSRCELGDDANGNTLRSSESALCLDENDNAASASASAPGSWQRHQRRVLR